METPWLFKCNICGHDVGVEEIDGIFHIDPCEVCLDVAREEVYEEVYDGIGYVDDVNIFHPRLR